MVAISINTFGEAGGLVSYSLLMCMISLTLTSFTSWKLIKVLKVPVYTPPPWLYYAGWIIVHVGWAISAFLVYWQPDPSAPAQPGRWGVFGFPLVFFLAHPLWVIIFHWTFWTYKFFAVAWWFLAGAFLWEIPVFLIFWLIGGSFIAGIVHAATALWIFYNLIFFRKIWACNGNNGPSEINFCSTVVETTNVTTANVPLTATTPVSSPPVDPLYDATAYQSQYPGVSSTLQGLNTTLGSVPVYSPTARTATVAFSSASIGSGITYGTSAHQQLLFKTGKLGSLLDEAGHTKHN